MLKVGPRVILLFRDPQGFGAAVADSLRPNPSSDDLHRSEESFELSLDRYGIKDVRATGDLIHFRRSDGQCEVSILLLQYYEPPILACALNEVLASITGDSSTEPTLVAPFITAAAKLKLENQKSVTNDKITLYGLQSGPQTDLTRDLGSKLPTPPPSLQIFHEQLACLLQLVRVLKMPAFVVIGQSGQSLLRKTSDEELEVIHEIGELLANSSSLCFLREKITLNPSRSSRNSEEPWRALYG